MKTLRQLLLVCGLGLALAAAFAAPGDFQATGGGAYFQDLRPGEGEPVGYGDVAVMHFVGWLAQDGARGREVFNTRNRGEPVSFVVGTDKVMEGWNLGVVGMRVGGQRLVLVPPGLAYGTRPRPQEIPPETSLLFLIELVAVEKAE